MSLCSRLLNYAWLFFTMCFGEGVFWHQNTPHIRPCCCCIHDNQLHNEHCAVAIELLLVVELSCHYVYHIRPWHRYVHSAHTNTRTHNARGVVMVRWIGLRKTNRMMIKQFIYMYIQLRISASYSKHVNVINYNTHTTVNKTHRTWSY